VPSPVPPVPELSSLVLFGAGILGLGIFIYIKKDK